MRIIKQMLYVWEYLEPHKICMPECNRSNEYRYKHIWISIELHDKYVGVNAETNYTCMSRQQLITKVQEYIEKTSPNCI